MALLIIMGCLVQAIGETLVTEVSVEIGKHISLLSNQALGPVLHSLIQMRVPHMGLAKIDPHYLCLTDTHSFHLALLCCSLSGISPVLSSFHLFFFPPVAAEMEKSSKSICIFDPHRLLWTRIMSLERCSL